MPPVFGPLSPSPTRLWSCAERERNRSLAVAEREERGFLAVEEFLDHDFPRRLARGRRRTSCRWRLRLLRPSRATTTPLPAASPSAFTTIGAPLRAHIVLGRRRAREALIGGGRDFVGPAQVLGEAFRAFQPRRRLARPEGLDAGRLQIVDDAGDQRRLRADHHEARSRCAWQNAITASWSARSSATHSASCAMPALPGAQ